MADWIRYDDNFDQYDGGGNGGCLYVKDNEDGTYNVAGVIWVDATGNEKPYYAFEARFENGDSFDDVTVFDQWTAGDAFAEATNSYVTTVLGEFDTLEEGVLTVDRFFLPTQEFLAMHPNV